MDTPRLSVPIVFLMCAILAMAIAWKAQLPDWIRVSLVAMGVLFAGAGVITGLNWIAYNTSARIKDMADARTLEARLMSNAIRDMSSSKAEAILSMRQTYIEMIVGEENVEPVFLVRTLDGVVPFEFVHEFLRLSKETGDYLYPERETSNWRWAQSLTNLIVAKGWAEHAKGSMPAMRTKSLDFIAARFGVDLAEEE